APSAHTYRLLVFKEHSPKSPNLNPSRSAAFASLQSQHRNEIMKNLFLLVNQVCEHLLSNLPTLEAACFFSGPRCETRRRIIGDGVHQGKDIFKLFSAMS
ncbi:hypothetical protein M0D69_10320, partial [Caballeronia sp. SEWSISQ10-4 2]|uniref:hypothetical protein n=1 Tax=Caballeronia sp. SEWSISQ10-4 2 TaxID=2937438 RepID=UPI002654205C